MFRANYRIGRTSASVALRHWLILAALAATIAGGAAAIDAAQLADSGWAVAAPSPLATGQPSDVRQQMLWYKVLDGGQRPLLEHASPTAEPLPGGSSPRNSLRVAVRPDGIAGWRPVGQGAGEPPAAAAAPQLEGPSLGAPAPAAVSTSNAGPPTESECDCSGQTTGTAGGEPPHSTAAAPALADAYGSITEAAEANETSGNPSAASAPIVQTTPEVPAETAPAPAVESAAQSGGEAAASNAPSSQEAAPDSGSGRGGVAETKAGDEDPTANSSAAAPSSSAAQSPSAADKRAATATAEVVSPPPLTRQLLALRSRVRSVLRGYYRKMLNSADNDPWEAMHGMLAYGVHSRIRQGGPSGNPITSVGWLCYNKPCKGQTMLYVNPEGELRAKYGVGVQGHLGQLLAMLAQCRVSADYPIRIGKNEFTIQDLIAAEKKTCYPKSELTFKLLALQYYIDLNDKWVNDQGLDWDFPRLLREEMAQPVRTAACGGTHRLSALSLTVRTRIRRGEPLDGEYAEAADFVKKYQQYAFRLQNRDGSLSTQWFKGPGDEDDDDRRIKTTGHILEWLCYSLSDEELRDQRTIRAVSYLANLMYSNYDHEWEVGPRSHAIHALLLYDERVFQPFDKEGSIASYLPQPNVAKNSQTNGKKR